MERQHQVMIEEDASGGDERWMLLERIADSAQLRRAFRLRELLFYLGRKALKEGCQEIHVQEIGKDVFGRREAYDTGADNIVRASVSELRKRLEAYFMAEGSREALRVEIPRGSYLPVFREAVVETSEPAPMLADILEIEERRSLPLWVKIVFASGLFTICLLAAGLVTFWVSERRLFVESHPWMNQPAVATFWSPFFRSNQETDLVMGDTAFQLVQTISNHQFSFNDYISRSYVNQVQDIPELDVRSIVSMLTTKNLGNSVEFRLATKIQALAPLDERLHLYSSRDYMPALTVQDNMILLGSKITNPWVSLFEDELNFVPSSDKNGFTTMLNHKPEGKEPSVYVPTDSEGYCVVAYLPNLANTSKVLLIEGTSSEAVEAASEFVLSEDELQRFYQKRGNQQSDYFEVLLKTSQVRSTPFHIQMLATRTLHLPS